MTLAPAEALERLAESRTPFLIGVRHHSPALAATIEALLDEAAPTLVAVELPADFAPWLAHLGHPDLVPPVALAGARDGGDLAFYPFAEISPELVALRWGIKRGISIDAIDLPLDRRPPRDVTSFVHEECTWMSALLARQSADSFEELWDRLVEARAPGSAPERVRRAALALGWAMRSDAAEGTGVPLVDRHREAHMRACIERAIARGERVAAVVGAFHAGALLRDALLFEPPSETLAPGTSPTTSLIAYDDELLDSRSGYPAGIRDPRWQRRWLEAVTTGDPKSIEALCGAVLAEIAREVRAAGHVAGVPDTREALRLAIDLARLRGLPAPARRELLEALETALARGERMGRGRIVARALDTVMVGRRRGRLAPGTPRSGLVPHVEALLAELRLPGPDDASTEPKSLRIDPERSWLDRRREVALVRLAVCGVPYGTLREGVAAGGIETLTRRWDVRWTPATEGALGLGSTRGVTLRQAAEGTLRARAKALTERDELTAKAQLMLTAQAAECGLPELASAWLANLTGPFLAEAGLPELLEAHALIERVARGHVPGLPMVSESGDVPAFRMPDAVRPEALLGAAVAALEATSGSEDVADARALLALVRLFERQPEGGRALGASRLGVALDVIAARGSPLMQGAAGAVRAATGRDDPRSFGERMGGWIDGASTTEMQRELAGRLAGALCAVGPLFEGDPAFLEPLIDRVEALDDDAFLERLPALREGFDALSPASRARLLTVIGERLDAIDSHHDGLDVRLHDDPARLAAHAEADTIARRAVEVLGLALLDRERTPVACAMSSRASRDHHIAALDRWRLVLGTDRRDCPPSMQPVAAALDELYGAGRGEGSRAAFGGGGGQERAFPSAREWGDALEALFGKPVRDEVLAKAAARGRTAALHELDAETVVPSVDLLETVLSLKGGLSEGQLGQLRRLVERVVRQLTDELAIRLRPALFGVVTARPTRRRSGPLDLRRTVRANLHTARLDDEGRASLVPETLIFQSRAQRRMDHRVILVVDVSGSMEASVIYSAMVAAILHGAPWVDVRFLAFSTEVIDLSERVDDPLGLLLEVQVGGGTHIAKGLRAARALVKVPQRTIVIVVSDFEEGFAVSGLLAEVRALVGEGVTALGVAALDDRGEPRYCRPVAEQVVAAGMPVAALTPLELARWIGEKLR